MQGLFALKKLDKVLLLVVLWLSATACSAESQSGTSQSVEGHSVEKPLPVEQASVSYTVVPAAIASESLTAEQNETIQWANLLSQINPGDEVAIASIKQVLNNAQTTEIAINAAIALGKIDAGSRQAVGILADLYESSEPSPQNEIQRRVAKGLGELGEKNALAVDELVRILTTAEHEWVLQDAVESLGKVGQENAAAIAALEGIIATPPTNALLLRSAESLSAIDPANSKAPAAVIDLFEQSENPATRLNAWRTLRAIAPSHPKTIEILSEHLSPSYSDDVQLNAEALEAQLSAAEALSAVKGYQEQILAALAEIAITPRDIRETPRISPFFSKRLTQLLQSVASGNPTVIKSLENALSASEDTPLRVQIAEALGTVDTGNEQAVSMLSDIIRTNESLTPQSVDTMWTRMKTASTLGRVAPQNELAISTLSTLLEAPQTLEPSQGLTFEEIRFRAAKALLQQVPNHPAATNTLLTLIETANGRVPGLVAKSLGDFDGEPASEALGDGEVSPSGDRTRFVDALTAFIQSERDARELIWGAQSLLSLDPENRLAISVLLEVLRNNDSESIGSQSAEILSSLASENAAVTEGLMDIVKNSPSLETQLIAADVLIQISSDHSTIIPLLHQRLEQAQSIN